MDPIIRLFVGAICILVGGATALAIGGAIGGSIFGILDIIGVKEEVGGGLGFAIGGATGIVSFFMATKRIWKFAYKEKS